MNDTRFLERYFTEYERQYIGARKNAAPTAAGIFAAKEALVKALGTGFGPLGPQDVSVRHDGQGAPFYEMNEKTLTALHGAGACRAMLSVSHDGDSAMAVAVIE